MLMSFNFSLYESYLWYQMQESITKSKVTIFFCFIN